MSDPFAELGFERRPGLDITTLKARYLSLAKEFHPDSRNGDAGHYQSLKLAYETLLDPASRLKALAGGASGNWHPPDTLFDLTAQAITAARDASHTPSASASPLVNALLSQKAARARTLVREARSRISSCLDDANLSLKELDARWPNVTAEELAGLSSEFKFLSRWASRLAEAGFELEHPAA